MTSSIERAESDVSEETTGASASIKFLVTNTLAGSIIGSKGTAIKELIEVSGARVSISGAQEFYPGTTDRVLLITGNLESLTTAIALIWELIYIHTKATATSQRVGVWSPEASKDALVAVDDIELTARLTVPAAAGSSSSSTLFMHENPYRWLTPWTRRLHDPHDHRSEWGQVQDDE